MEILIAQSELVRALHAAQGIVDKKSTLTVLSHVLLETVSESELRLSCTDYDASLIASHSCEVLKQGSVAVSGKSLFDIVRSLPGDRVHISVDAANWIEIKCGSAYFRVAGMGADEFPKISAEKDVRYLPVKNQLLLDMIDRTHFSVSSDETRMNLNGIFVKITKDYMTMVSTDGHRLSRAQQAIENKEGLEASGILHKKGAFELRRLLDPVGECLLGFHKGSVYLKLDNSLVIIRQIDDEFPDVEKVIPASNELQVEVSRHKLLDALKRVSLVSSNKTWGIKLELRSDLLLVTSSQPDIGEGREEIPVDYAGRDLIVGYNVKYIIDVLGCLDSETVTFGTNDEYSATVITSNDEPGVVFVIMPMRI